MAEFEVRDAETDRLLVQVTAVDAVSPVTAVAPGEEPWAVEALRDLDVVGQGWTVGQVTRYFGRGAVFRVLDLNLDVTDESAVPDAGALAKRARRRVQPR